MNKIHTVIATLLISLSFFAQAPEKISYQAVLRDASNTLLTSTTVGMQISILQGSTTGSSVYTETHSAATNNNGLISVEIGTGTVTSGTFANIDWATGTYFVKTETDPAGGTTYTITGTSQLLSAPYALHAKTAKTAESVTGSLSGTATGQLQSWDNTNSEWVIVANTPNEGATLQMISGVPTWTGGTPPPAIGDFQDGGIVFYVADEPTDLDGDGNLDTGLVCAVMDQNGGATTQWEQTPYTVTGATSFDIGGGATNTDAIIATINGSYPYAAGIARAYNGGGYTDWFLPSEGELQLMANHKATIDTAASNNGGSNLVSAYYWSSSEWASSNAKVYHLGNNSSGATQRSSSTYFVRAVRAF
jgi:hypothetical protein